MSKTTLSSPWVSYARKIYMLFGKDPEINVVYVDDGPEVKLLVDNSAKAEALSKKLPIEKTFGNVTLKITVIPSNKEESNIDCFRKIFAGNPIVDEIVNDNETVAFGFSHVVFRNEVVQYFDDRLNDLVGAESTLYEDLARDVFVDADGVYFNTNVDEDFEIWP